MRSNYKNMNSNLDSTSLNINDNHKRVIEKYPVGSNAMHFNKFNIHVFPFLRVRSWFTCIAHESIRLERASICSWLQLNIMPATAIAVTTFFLHFSCF